MLLAAVAGALAVAYFGWFRDSSLVAVKDVKVVGVSSSDRGRIVAELTRAAQGMTTLHVRTDRLRSAVKDLPTVASLSADASFPHGLTINVTERRPALLASDGDREVPVSPDGSLLAGIDADGDLPKVGVESLPGSGRLSGEPLAEALVIGAAPEPLHPLIETTALSSDYGIVAIMRGGIELRFGTAEERRAKWAAAAAVLSDPGLTMLSYLDVRAPERPAVGGTPDPSPATTPVTPTSTAVVTAP